jgi:periplasmic divalent cation tolerance protein
MSVSEIPLLVACTTVDDREIAYRLAQQSIELRLAACAQVDGPLVSFYRWQGAVECGNEWRITWKVDEPRVAALRDWLHAEHPYQIPQWVVVQAAAVGAAYAKWVATTATGG